MADAVYVSLMAELDFITRLVDSANTVEGHVAAARAAGKVRSLFASDAYNKITISFPQYLSAYVVAEPGGFLSMRFWLLMHASCPCVGKT